MNAFLAIVADTWRQSRQQVVFIILIVLLFLTAVISVGGVKVHESEDGEKQFGILFFDDPVDDLEDAWIQSYATTLRIEDGTAASPFSEEGRQQMREDREALDEAEKLAADIPPFQRSVEMWIYGTTIAIFMVSMALFIAACSSYFPDMLSAGAVDVVLAKPVSRLQILLGKYVGGLALFAAVVAATDVLIFVGIGARTGIWHGKIFQALPVQVFSAGVLYALLALFGVLKRSTALAMIIGYFFYFIVDSALGLLMGLQQLGTFEDIEWLDRGTSIARVTLPNFEILKNLSSSLVLNIPVLDLPALVTAAAWLFVALALTHWRFSKADF